jgi:hypothetical protein
MRKKAVLVLAAAAIFMVPSTATAATNDSSSDNGVSSAYGPGAFITNGDNVHVSSTPPPTASGHGWWVKVSGPGTTAKVTVWLQSNWAGSGWVTRATGVKTVKSGGGSANRATARWQCRNLVAKVQWRSVIDVDLIGVADSPERAVTATRTLYCGV